MSIQRAISHPPEVIVKFVRELIDEQHAWTGEERRAEPRQSVSVPVEIQPLTDDYQPYGASFVGITKNLSGGGIGFLHDAPVDQSFVQVTLNSRSGDSIDLIANIRHCDFENGKYLIGGRFVARWDERDDHRKHL